MFFEGAAYSRRAARHARRAATGSWLAHAHFLATSLRARYSPSIIIQQLKCFGRCAHRREIILSIDNANGLRDYDTNKIRRTSSFHGRVDMTSGADSISFYDIDAFYRRS